MNWLIRLFTRSESRDIGQRGEDTASRFLREIGYQILERNWRCRLGEIDIVCRHAGTLVFVEVKTSLKRGVFPPEARVNFRKKTKLVRLAKLYVKQRKLDMPVQFDVVSVWFENGTPRLEHFPNAFSI